MTRKPAIAHFLTAAALPLAVAAAPLTALAEEDELEFDEAFLFFELNNTDGDLGIHAKVDGGPWKKLEIEDTREREILDIKVRGRLRRQGLTEIFFESAEPTFDELSPRRFFRRFPAGIYEIEGETLDGVEIENEVELTHVMPAPPEAFVNGEPMADQCDDEEPGFNPTETSAPVVLSWNPVVMSHPDLGVMPPVEVEIHNYEVVVETTIEIGDEEFETTFSVILPPGQTSMTIPDEFIAQAEEFKYEILAREVSYNQTAVESCFVLAEE